MTDNKLQLNNSGKFSDAYKCKIVLNILNKMKT